MATPFRLLPQPIKNGIGSKRNIRRDRLAGPAASSVVVIKLRLNCDGKQEIGNRRRRITAIQLLAARADF